MQWAGSGCPSRVIRLAKGAERFPAGSAGILTCPVVGHADPGQAGCQRSQHGVPAAGDLASGSKP